MPGAAFPAARRADPTPAASLRSCLYEGHVAHARAAPVRHAFRHPVYMWLVDLGELDELDRRLVAFGHNRRALTTIHSRDHLGEPSRSVAGNLLEYLRLNGITLQRPRLTMLTNARVLGHVFNPITVFHCYDAGELRCVVAEVHNTIGQRHCYLLHPGADGVSELGKEFYVSPFLEVSGGYRIAVPPPGERLAVRMQLVQSGRVVFGASLTGRRLPLTNGTLAWMLARHPLMPLRVSALIRRHGLALHVHGVPHAARPDHVPQQGVG